MGDSGFCTYHTGLVESGFASAYIERRNGTLLLLWQLDWAELALIAHDVLLQCT
jgi:hypothetical protein